MTYLEVHAPVWVLELLDLAAQISLDDGASS